MNSCFSHKCSNVHRKSWRYCPSSIGLSDFTTFFIIYQVICWCVCMWLCSGGSGVACFCYLFRNWFPETFRGSHRLSLLPFLTGISSLFDWPLTEWSSLLHCQKIFFLIIIITYFFISFFFFSLGKFAAGWASWWTHGEVKQVSGLA